MKLLNYLLALILPVLFAGGALAHDQCDHAHGPQGDGSRIAAMHTKHQAQLHDKLKLSADQEAAWKTFTEKTKPDLARRKAVREEMATLTTPARMDRMLALMKEGETRMAERAAAVKEFYAALTPEQQKTFDAQHQAWHQRQAGKRPPHDKAHGAVAPPAAK